MAAKPPMAEVAEASTSWSRPSIRPVQLHLDYSTGDPPFLPLESSSNWPLRTGVLRQVLNSRSAVLGNKLLEL